MKPLGIRASALISAFLLVVGFKGKSRSTPTWVAVTPEESWSSFRAMKRTSKDRGEGRREGAFQESGGILGMTARRQAKERGKASSRSVGGSVGLEATASRGTCEHDYVILQQQASLKAGVGGEIITGWGLGQRDTAGQRSSLLLPLIWGRK